MNASNFMYHAGIPFQKLMINTQLVEAGPTVNLKKDHMKDFLIKKKKKSTIKKQFYVTYHKKYIGVSVPEEHGPTLLYLLATFTFSVYKAQ